MDCFVNKRRLEMSLILCYCEKCGQEDDLLEEELGELKSVTCMGCHNS